jgi:hypothetical protein
MAWSGRPMAADGGHLRIGVHLQLAYGARRGRAKEGNSAYR